MKKCNEEQLTSHLRWPSDTVLKQLTTYDLLPSEADGYESTTLALVTNRLSHNLQLVAGVLLYHSWFCKKHKDVLVERMLPEPYLS